MNLHQLGGYPIGAVIPMTEANLPVGWMLCDGSLLDSTDPRYVQLFLSIGFTYNIGGEPAGFFRIPDCRARIMATVSYDGVNFVPGLQNLGNTGGVEVVSLLASELPVHTHAATSTLVDTSHSHEWANMIYGANEAHTGKDSRGQGPMRKFATSDSGASQFASGNNNSSVAHLHNGVSGGVTTATGSPHNNVQTSTIYTVMIRYGSPI